MTSNESVAFPSAHALATPDLGLRIWNLRLGITSVRILTPYDAGASKSGKSRLVV